MSINARKSMIVILSSGITVMDIAVNDVENVRVVASDKGKIVHAFRSSE
jgi:hypothetical protein